MINNIMKRLRRLFKSDELPFTLGYVYMISVCIGLIVLAPWTIKLGGILILMMILAFIYNDMRS